MKQTLQLQITGQKPFSDGKFMNFTANSPTGVIEGICWEAALHHYFTPGNSIVIEVGSDKTKDGAAFTEYKGKTRLEVTKTAELGFGIRDAAPAPYQAPQPAFQPPPQPQYAAPPVHAPQHVSGGVRPQNGERPALTRLEILNQGIQDSLHVYNELVREGAPEDLAIRAAAAAPTWPALNWFGEKSC